MRRIRHTTVFQKTTKRTLSSSSPKQQQQRESILVRNVFQVVDQTTPGDPGVVRWEGILCLGDPPPSLSTIISSETWEDLKSDIQQILVRYNNDRNDDNNFLIPDRHHVVLFLVVLLTVGLFVVPSVIRSIGPSDWTVPRKYHRQVPFYLGWNVVYVIMMMLSILGTAKCLDAHLRWDTARQRSQKVDTLLQLHFQQPPPSLWTRSLQAQGFRVEYRSSSTTRGCCCGPCFCCCYWWHFCVGTPPPGQGVLVFVPVVAVVEEGAIDDEDDGYYGSRMA